MKEQAKKFTQLFGPQKILCKRFTKLLVEWAVATFLLEQLVLPLPYYIHFQKEYGFGTSALSVSACTVFEKRMDSITPVALTAHHTPNLMYCIGTSHKRLELSDE